MKFQGLKAPTEVHNAKNRERYTGRIKNTTTVFTSKHKIKSNGLRRGKVK